MVFIFNFIAIIFITFILKKRLFDLSGLKKFYFWGVLFLVISDLITLLGNNEIEYLYTKIMLYLLFWILLNIYEGINDLFKTRLIAWALYGTILFSCIQLLLNNSGGYWTWGESSYINEIANLSLIGRVSNVLWVIFSVTLGVFIMQLMSEIDEDRYFVLSLFLTLFYLVLMIGIGGYGLYPMVWYWIYSAIYLGLCDSLLERWIKYREENRPNRVNILGLKVDNVNETEAIEKINNLVRDKNLSLVVTPYSEFFVKIRKNSDFNKGLSYAKLSIPDGIYVNWASLYQRLPVSTNKMIRILQCIWQYVFSGACIILYPRLVRAVVKERVSGSDIIYPVCALAEKYNYKVFFHGGFNYGKGNTGILAANKLKTMYPKLNIVSVYPGENKVEKDEIAISEINKYHPDIVFMCLGTREPQLVYKYRNELKCGVVIALGGTFDYVSGNAKKVSRQVSESGLEWFVRPIMLLGTGGLKSMVNRFKRVWTGMIIGSFLILAWKIKFGYIEKDK